MNFTIRGLASVALCALTVYALPRYKNALNVAVLGLIMLGVYSLYQVNFTSLMPELTRAATSRWVLYIAVFVLYTQIKRQYFFTCLYSCGDA